MNEDEEKARLHARLDKRFEVLKSKFDKLHRQVDQGVMGGEPGRLWLEKWCVGRGVQLAPGDFSLGDSAGVDQDLVKVGTDIWGWCDQFDGNIAPPIDYVVTNYLECWPDTLQVLERWTRILREGGIFAIVCRDSDVYRDDLGPLRNKNRVTCFNLRTLTCCLTRAGLKVKEYEKADFELRIAAVKLGESAK